MRTRTRQSGGQKARGTFHLVAAVAVMMASAGTSVAGTVSAVPVTDDFGRALYFNVSFADVGGPSTLYLLSDTEDRGTSASDWAQRTDLGTVRVADGVRRVELPQGWGSEVKVVRFLLTDYRFPDGVKRVEYVVSSGSQYVNTGYIGQYGDSFEANFRILEFPPNNYERCLLGAFSTTSGSKNRYVPIDILPGHQVIFALNEKWYTNAGSVQIPTVNDDFWAKTVFERGDQKVFAGATAESMSVSLSESDRKDVANTTVPLTLFARNGDSTPDTFCKARLYSCCFKHEDEIVREFVPCVSNDVAGLFDIANRKFYSDDSGGAQGLTAGPDAPGSEDSISDAIVYVQEASGFSVVLKGAYAKEAEFALQNPATASGNCSVSFGIVEGADGEVCDFEQIFADVQPGWNGTWKSEGLKSGTAYTYAFKVESDGGETETLGGSFVTQGGENRTIDSVAAVAGDDGRTYVFRIQIGETGSVGDVLYAVWDEFDHGERKEDWPNREVIGSVRSGDLIEWRPSLDIIGRQIVLRFLLVGGGTVFQPIDYIETTGAEFVNTGYVGQFGDEFLINARFLAYGTGNHDSVLLGSYEGSASSANKRYVAAQIQGQYGLDFVFTLNEKWFNPGSGAVKASLDSDFWSKTVVESGSQEIFVGPDLNNLAKSISASITDPVANRGAPLYLFARNCGNTGVDSFSKARLYSCQIKHEGLLVRDFVPYIYDEQIGLYDKVGKKFYPDSSGAGGFKSPVEVVPGAVTAFSPPCACVAGGVMASTLNDDFSLSVNGTKIMASGSLANMGSGTTCVALDWGVKPGGWKQRVFGCSVTADDDPCAVHFAIPFRAYGPKGEAVVYCRLVVVNRMELKDGSVVVTGEAYSPVKTILARLCPKGLVFMLK